jgi:heat-inducible transcriptional repressor
MFVDRLTLVKPLSAAERRAIQAFLDEAVDLDDVLGRAVRTLAQLTRNVAVVQYPSLSRSRVRHVELVALNASRLMLVLITDTGRVEQRVVELPGPVPADTVVELRNTLNARLHDRLLAEAPQVVSELPATVAPALRGLISTLIAVLLDALLEKHNERVVLGGTANLTEHTLDFPAIRPVLEALEEQVVLLRLLDQSMTSSQIVVSIGNENEHAGLVTTSVVASGYRARGAAVGAIGVLGPRRMDYAHTMARVAAVARYVGELLDER